MKKLKVPLLLLVVLALLVGGVGTLAASPTKSNPTPTLVIEPSHILKLGSGTKVAIMGSGYEPGQEIRILITQSDGSKSDIGAQLDPEPVANDDGVWGTAWTVGRFSHKKIAAAGIYVMMACDTSYNVLATAPFGYYDSKKPYEEWPSWAQAVVAKPKE